MPIEFVTVVEKEALSPKAAASSFRVSKAVGAPPTKFDIAVSIASFTAAFDGTFVSLSLLIMP